MEPKCRSCDDVDATVARSASLTLASWALWLAPGIMVSSFLFPLQGLSLLVSPVPFALPGSSTRTCFPVRDDRLLDPVRLDQPPISRKVELEDYLTLP